MASIFVRSLALLLSILLFGLAYHEPSAGTVGFLGGAFFLSLFMAAFFEKKFFYLCMGALFLYPPLFGIFTGTIFGFGRAATNKVLARDPSAFWVTMVLWLLASIGLLSYGIYKAFRKDDSP